MPDCLSTCSFAGTSDQTLAAVLAQVDAAANGYPNYAGVAVEDFIGWSKLPPR